MRTLNTIRLVVCLSLIVLPLQAQWTQTNGPGGGTAQTIIAMGDFLFAGSYGGGVFRSSDDGFSWTPVSAGIPNAFVNDIVAYGSVVLAGTNGGLFRSTDNGLTWDSVSLGVPATFVTKLGMAAGTLFAGTYPYGVFRSTDAGAHWLRVSLIPGDTTWPCTAFASIGADLFIAQGVTRAVYRSRDTGATWSVANAGLTGSIHSLAVSGSTIYGAGDYGQLFRSNDHGTSWAVAARESYLDDILCLLPIGSSLYAGFDSRGLGVTTDSGATWKILSSDAARVTSLAITKTGRLVGTWYGGVLQSVDTGAHWTATNNGIVNTSVRMIEAANGALVASTMGGVGLFRSTDAGKQWDKLPTNFDRTDISACVRLGTKYFAATVGAGIYMSADNGQTWKTMNTGLTDLVVFVLSGSGDDLYVGTQSGNVFRSSDEGATWTPLARPGGAHPIRTIITAGSSLYVGTENSGTFRSDNNGATWTHLLHDGQDFWVSAIASVGGDIFIGDGSGLYRSSDQGSSWTQMATQAQIKFVQTLLGADSTLFVGMYGGLGVMMSRDRGNSWMTINTGFPAADVLSLAVDAANLYAGTLYRGVWKRPLAQLTTDVTRPESPVPSGYSLQQNFPNPFNPSTTFSFSLPMRSFVTVKVFDVTGREVTTLLSEEMPAGSSTRVWNAAAMPSGVYFCTIHARNFVDTKKIVLIR